jgi:hypothetical protein
MTHIDTSLSYKQASGMPTGTLLFLLNFIESGSVGESGKA